MKNLESLNQVTLTSEEIHIEDKILTSLMQAIEEENLENFQLLLEKITDIDAKDDNGWTVLHKAINKQNIEFIEILIKKGIKIDAQDNGGWAPIHLAAFIGNEKITQILLDNRAEIYVKNNKNYFPWQIAVLMGNLKIAKRLIQLKIDNKVEYEKDAAFIVMMIKSPYLTKDHYNIIKQLILSGVNLTKHLPVKNTIVNNLISGICKDIKNIAQNNEMNVLAGKYDDPEDIEFAAQLFVNLHKFGTINYNAYADIKQKIISCNLLHKQQNASLKNALLKKLEQEQKAGLEFMTIAQGEIQYYLYEAESPVSRCLIEINEIKKNADLSQENKEKLCNVIYKDMEKLLIKLLKAKEHNLNHIAIAIIESEINNREIKDNFQKLNIIKSFKIDIWSLGNHLLPSINMLKALRNVIKKYHEYSENELQLIKNAEQIDAPCKIVNLWNLTEEQQNQWNKLNQEFLAKNISESADIGLMGNIGHSSDDDKADIFLSDHH